MPLGARSAAAPQPASRGVRIDDAIRQHGDPGHPVSHLRWPARTSTPTGRRRLPRTAGSRARLRRAARRAVRRHRPQPDAADGARPRVARRDRGGQARLLREAACDRPRRRAGDPRRDRPPRRARWLRPGHLPRRRPPDGARRPRRRRDRHAARRPRGGAAPRPGAVAPRSGALLRPGRRTDPRRRPVLRRRPRQPARSDCRGRVPGRALDAAGDLRRGLPAGRRTSRCTDSGQP